jgi:hypothetical protein
LLLIAVLAVPVLGVASPAHATCHPEKPSTCPPCRITGIEFGENGLPRFTTDC